MMRVVILGGGIAGFALARFLRERGEAPVVIERAQRFSSQGHFISLKGDGVAILDRLGIREPVAAHAWPATTELRVHTWRGRLLRVEPLGALQRAVQGVLGVRRADLHQALYERVRDDVEIRFGVEARSWREDGDQAIVTFSDGREERADVVVGAEGVHSPTRQFLFGDTGVQPLGASYVALEVPWAGELPPGALGMYLGPGRFVEVLPMTGERTAAVVYHAEPGLRRRLKSPAALRAFFAEHYADFEPGIRQLFSQLGDDSFVFVDDIVMVSLPAPTRGRFALLGDAGECPTFLSGMGSAHAMLSAEVLAQRVLAAGPARVPEGLAAWAEEMRPRVARLHANARRTRSVLLTQSRALATLRDTLLAVAPHGWMMDRARSLYSS